MKLCRWLHLRGFWDLITSFARAARRHLRRWWKLANAVDCAECKLCLQGGAEGVSHSRIDPETPFSMMPPKYQTDSSAETPHITGVVFRRREDELVQPRSTPFEQR